ncbi:2-amino-4-hydroxy-6-hydroxymethyldihydropteridine diphosphokinase [Thioalkalivibrio sp.]|uniref:2-amino-4-hydroxy-6- hydroxymethyldihydropteridine diphosphokinase n=1 Tax=Thioalkalivibrio sp. TaxID=2093813 RepID=UPI003975F1AC
MSLAPRQARRAFVGLGSNVEPARHLRAALEALGRAFAQLRRSPVCVSPAAGYEGPDYWNLCVAFDTQLSAQALVAWLKELERGLGRRSGEPRHAPKTLDADLLLLGDEISAEPPLPHPEILTRVYVLGPLAMLDPGHRLPGITASVGELWRDLPGSEVLTVLAPDPLSGRPR